MPRSLTGHNYSDNAVPQFVDDVAVHATHCCPDHGCKYSDVLCPVASGHEATRYSNNNGCERCAPIFAAVAAGKDKARLWTVCDPETNIPAEAARQIALAAIDAYLGEDF